MSDIEGPIPSNQAPAPTTSGTVGSGGAISVRNTLSSGSQTQVIEATEVTSNSSEPPTLKLRLKNSEESDASTKGEKQKPKKVIRKQVSWTQETVDNEHLGKKKSKCCCVYVKPRSFGESDTESEDEGTRGSGDDCKHCSGHTQSDPNKGSRS